jgi:hypothetical protein
MQGVYENLLNMFAPHKIPQGEDWVHQKAQTKDLYNKLVSGYQHQSSSTHEDVLFDGLNKTYENIVIAVAENFPEDTQVQSLCEMKLEGKGLYNKLALECDSYDNEHPNETIAYAVRACDVKILSQLDTFSFLSDKLEAYSTTALNELGREMKDMFIQYQLLRTCHDKWNIVSPIVDAIKNTNTNSWDPIKIQDFVKEINGEDQKLANEFSSPNTYKHMVEAAKMFGLGSLFESSSVGQKDTEENATEENATEE